jgi:hypothetical protein
VLVIPDVSLQAPALLPFTIATSEQTSTPNRLRWAVEAVIPSEAEAGQVAATCAEIARRTLRERVTVLSLMVFGYFDQTEIGNGYTRCRATLSRDGKGWTGDGKALNGDDTGDVIVEIAKTAVSSQGRRINVGVDAIIHLPK